MGWSCPFCTLINEELLIECDGCGSLRQQPKPEGGLRGMLAGIQSGVSNAVSSLSSVLVDLTEEVKASLSPSQEAVIPRPPPYNVFDCPSPAPLSPSSPTSNSFSDPSSPSIAPATTSSSTPPPRPPMPNASRRGPTRSRGTSSYHSANIAQRGKKDIKEAEAVCQRILENCKSLNTSFVDDTFPPTVKSLGPLSSQDGAIAVPGHISEHSIVWLRPQQIYTKDGRSFPWSVFNDPNSSDIEQGALGDCWLLSAMALIAERPDVLEKIMLTKTYNATGVYQIRLCVDGQWRVLLVDDLLPCRGNTRSLAFAVGRKNQLWVPLIEKAYAKALGSYARLRAGRTVEGLALLTGAPCESISLDESDVDHDVVWAQLLSAREAGYVMGCSCGAGQKQVSQEEYSRKGLLTQHAYSILDVRQEGTHRLMRIRNPWGSFVWKGAWSDGWSGWPADLKRKLLAPRTAAPSGHGKDVGVFWIEYNDFKAHFDSVDLAKIRDHLSWTELRIPSQIGGAWADDAVSLRLVVEEPTELCCTLFHCGSRSALDNEDLLVCVHEVDPNGRVGALATRSPRVLSKMVTTGDFFLKSGHYVITAFSLSSFNRPSYRFESTLVVHSNRLLFGEVVPCPPQMATDSLVHLILKEGRVQKSMPGVTPRFLTRRFNGLVCMVDNGLPNMHVHIHTDCSGSMNVLSSRGSLDCRDSIPPMSRQIIIILSHFEASSAYTVENRLIVRTAYKSALGDWTPPHAIANGRGQRAVATPTSAVTTPTVGGDHYPPFDHAASSALHAPRSVFF